MIKKTLLLTLAQVPEYMKDNMYVRTGYRPEMPVCKALFSGICGWHNESLNIWTHLLTVVLFFIFLMDTITKSKGNHDNPKWPIIVFQAGVIYVMLMSTLYHTVLCVSKGYYLFFRNLDFTAIALVMFSMFVPVCVYAFKDHRWATLYIIVAALITCFCFFVVFTPSFQSIKTSEIARPLVYGLLAIWGIIPIMHSLYLNGAVMMPVVKLWFLSQCLFAIGAFFYVSSIPERSYVSVDYCNSHSIFHIFVTLGFLAYNKAVTILYQQKIKGVN